MTTIIYYVYYVTGMLSNPMTTITIPVTLRQRIKILSAIEGVSMIDFVDKLVQKREQARRNLPQNQTGKTNPQGSVREC
jgi:hypothetical protein